MPLVLDSLKHEDKGILIGPIIVVRVGTCIARGLTMLGIDQRLIVEVRLDGKELLLKGARVVGMLLQLLVECI